jgi:rSAM/selenodomain-associated transferase 1
MSAGIAREGARGAGIILVFAKAPAAGAVKTRLASALGQGAAAELARAFLRDTWMWLQTAAEGEAAPVLALAGDPSSIDLPGAEIWPQGSGDLGERLARGITKALERARWVIAIGADSPGLPAELLRAAIGALREGEEDSVIGPCDDGGFYLLGLRRCPEGIFNGLPWSEATTFDATLARLRERGLRTAILDAWFDVDRPDDLERLAGLLVRNEISAPATYAALERIGALGRLDRTGERG